jgi:ABC-type multidrug transport system fused ATPase/permease subunit
MKEYIKILQEWHKLAKPSKSLTFWAFFTVTLTQVCLLIAPIFTVKATVSIINGLYVSSIIYLIIVFAFLFFRNTIWHINYMIYSKIIRHSYNKINNDFVNISLFAKKKNFKSMPKEKILNIIHTDIQTVSDFADKLATVTAKFVILIVTIIIIIAVNYIAGLIVILADIINYFVISWLNKRRSVYIKGIRESQDYQFQAFGEIVDKRDLVIDMGLDETAKTEYNTILNKYINNLHKKTFWDSLVDNYFPVFYSFLILVATVLLVLFVSQGQLTVETYFVIVSYITTGIENSNSIYTIIYRLRDTSIATERIKTVMNFVEKSKVKYGENDLKDILGSINFVNVNYNKDDEGNPSLIDFDVLLKENHTHLILGKKNSGKRTIFNLLRRAITPESGAVYFDGVNIADYNKKAYQDNICYVTTKPIFLKGSIMKNLSIIENNLNVIFDACKLTGIYDYIDSLPDKFNTDIDYLSYEKQYLLLLTRAILTRTEIMVIYELPSFLSDEEKENIKNILSKIHGSRTILIFSGQDFCVDFADKIIEIEKGRIKQIQFNSKCK